MMGSVDTYIMYYVVDGKKHMQCNSLHTYLGLGLGLASRSGGTAGMGASAAR